MGYGDIYPVTMLGRMVGAFIAFSGIAAVAIPSGIISSALMERLSQDKEAAEQTEAKEKQYEQSRILNEQLELLKRIHDKISQSGK